MRRAVSAGVAGAVFGLGLMVSGMTDTTKVQGWLDVFGDWDPTLAFVMGGAILPMAVAWRVAARRRLSVLGTPLPRLGPQRLDPGLIWGSVVFGAGWALAGLCPGPALASISFGGIGSLAFFAAMVVGMLAAAPLRAAARRAAAPT